MSNSYKPGDVVPESGIYKVQHDSHRLMHTATLLRETLFPLCRHCGQRVRFELRRQVKSSQVPAFRDTAHLKEYPLPDSPFEVAA
ncbi:MAG: hypothetical protein DMG65_20850 [Candidatus Angelobacter sp. Gp1-AA117]|nr:MAG: hypothetical protein DMG65_20850 [Candidatus Angelobacter sp. Gp1-AA117]